VVICGRRQEPLDAVVARIRAAGGKAEAVQADVSDETQYVGAIEAAAQRHGRLDVLVNNAMAYTWGALESPPPPTGTPTSRPRSTAPSGARAPR
jgi:meso-butanediol dehydrogenase/(S,S)-butanediol dehydrogenase/diacetyl reductase